MFHEGTIVPGELRFLKWFTPFIWTYDGPYYMIMYELDVKMSSYLEYIFQFEVPIDLILVLDTRRFGFQDVRSYICANWFLDFKKFEMSNSILAVIMRNLIFDKLLWFWSEWQDLIYFFRLPNQRFKRIFRDFNRITVMVEGLYVITTSGIP